MDSIINHYQQKKLVLGQILDLTVKNGELIQEGLFEDLEVLLDQRQVLIEEINKLDQIIEEAKASDISNLVNSLHTADASVLLKEINSLLLELNKKETQNKANLEQELRSLKQKMLESNTNKWAQKAYASNPGQDAGYFIDNKK